MAERFTHLTHVDGALYVGDVFEFQVKTKSVFSIAAMAMCKASTWALEARAVANTKSRLDLAVG